MIPAEACAEEEQAIEAGAGEDRKVEEESAAKWRKGELDETMHEIRQREFNRQKQPEEPQGLEEKIQKVVDNYEEKKKDREHRGIKNKEVERMLREEMEAFCERLRAEAQVEEMEGEDRAVEESEEARAVGSKKPPAVPSEAEWRKHRLTQWHFRSWCPVRVLQLESLKMCITNEVSPEKRWFGDTFGLLFSTQTTGRGFNSSACWEIKKD